MFAPLSILSFWNISLNSMGCTEWYVQFVLFILLAIVCFKMNDKGEYEKDAEFQLVSECLVNLD